MVEYSGKKEKGQKGRGREKTKAKRECNCITYSESKSVDKLSEIGPRVGLLTMKYILISQVACHNNIILATNNRNIHCIF